MACFIVPATEAIASTIISAVTKKNPAVIKSADNGEVTFVNRLGRLNGMLWGGSALLAFEHLWHGEISPFAPFLTAAATPESTQIMLHEMATSGVAMAVVVTAAWAVTVAVEKMAHRHQESSEAEVGK